MSFSPLIKQLIDALVCLPGVGPRTAQRMSLYLLERNRDGGKTLATILEKAMRLVTKCKQCRLLCETDLCNFCLDSRRLKSLLCIVETPSDVAAIENSAGFSGRYFVLGGRLSPLDGIGPEDIGVKELMAWLDLGEITEVVIATNPTVEGEATAFYLAELIKEYGIAVSRIAHGVPLGGELEYVDGGTIARALSGRLPV